jgi:hypothetical protein
MLDQKSFNTDQIFLKNIIILHTSLKINDFKTEISLYDAAPWKKVILLFDVLLTSVLNPLF